MPIQLEHNLYICRISKDTKVYKEYNDINPSNKRALIKDIFISAEQAKLDTNTMFHISSPLDDKTYSDDIPYDMWVPSAVIEYYPMEGNAGFNIPLNKSEYFLANKQQVNVFDNSWSHNPLLYGVEEGDFIETDMYVIRENEKGRHTRYRIKAINNDYEHRCCGLWVEGNQVIYSNGLKMSASDNSLMPVDKNSPSILYKKKRIEDNAYEDFGDKHLNRYTDSGEGYASPYVSQPTTSGKPADNWMCGKTIDTSIRSAAITMAKANGVKLETSNFTRSYMIDGSAKDKYEYWKYYNVAALYVGGEGAMFTHNLDGNPIDPKMVRELKLIYIRSSYALGFEDKNKIISRNFISQNMWNDAKVNESTHKTGYVTSQSQISYTQGGGSNTQNSEYAEASSSDLGDASGTVNNSTISSNGYTEEQAKADRAAAAGEITWKDTTLNELYQTYGLVYTTDVSLTQVPIGRLSFVHGMPFQYTYLTDRRNNLDTPFGREMYETDEPVKMTKNTGAGLDMYGRTFAREIAANTPVVVFTPGVPKFMSNIRQSIFGYHGGEKNARNGFLNLFADLSFFESGSALQSMFDDLEGEVFQYYSLEINTADYFAIVNSLCQFSAKLLGLEKTKMRNIACTNFDWAAYNTNEAHDYSTMEDIFGVSRGVSFAFDPVSSIQDSITNTPQESQFAGFFNGVSDKSRELAFMLGSVDIDLEMIDQNEYTAAVRSVSSGAFSGLTNPMSAVFSMLKNSAHGMKVRFPQLWNDSSYSKSYSLDMKFITPYATKFCKWRYVLVPFFHIFALAAPQSKDTIINYSRPFLVKAFSRGYFNIEMGMIEQLSWKRYGDGEMLSVDGIPTEIDVSVDLVDLYQQLAVSTHYGDNGIASFDRIKVFFNNSGLQELLGNLAGIDTNRVTLSERLALYVSTIRGSLGGSAAGLGRHIQDRLLTNNVARWFYGMSGSAV
jgi:hypothetical protein